MRTRPNGPPPSAPVLVGLSDDPLTTTIDPAERQRLQRGRFVARDRAETILNSIGDAVLSTDMAGNITYLNVAAETMTAGRARRLRDGR